MLRIRSLITYAAVSAAISGCVHPETHAAASKASGSVDTDCVLAVEGDPFYVALKESCGVAESCDRMQDQENGIDFGEVLTVTWEGVEFRREQRPPESTVIEVRFAPSVSFNQSWFERQRDNLIPPALGIDWTKDVAHEPNVDHYLSSDPSFNGSVRVVSDDEGDLESIRLSYAL